MCLTTRRDPALNSSSSHRSTVPSCSYLVRHSSVLIRAMLCGAEVLASPSPRLLVEGRSCRHRGQHGFKRLALDLCSNLLMGALNLHTLADALYDNPMGPRASPRPPRSLSVCCRPLLLLVVVLGGAFCLVVASAATRMRRSRGSRTHARLLPATPDCVRMSCIARVRGARRLG